MTTIYVNGAVVLLWEATCWCGFVSGMAEVTLPDGTKRLLSGAGCRSRRGPKEARAWADAQVAG